MKKLLLFLFPLFFIQAQTTTLRPDCILQVNVPVGSAVPFNIGPFDNRTIACTSWTFAYNSYTYSALSIIVQTAPNVSAGVPGSWSTFAPTNSTSNPQTDTTKGIATFGGPTIYFPWLRVQLTSATGAGTISGTLYGYRNPAASVTPVTPSTCPAAPDGSYQYDNAGACAGAVATYHGPATSLNTLTLNIPNSTPSNTAITGTTTASMIGTGGTLTGIGTLFSTEVKVGDCIGTSASGDTVFVGQIVSDTNILIGPPICTASTIGDGTSQTLFVMPAPYSFTRNIKGGVNNGVDVLQPVGNTGNLLCYLCTFRDYYLGSSGLGSYDDFFIDDNFNTLLDVRYEAAAAGGNWGLAGLNSVGFKVDFGAVGSAPVFTRVTSLDTAKVTLGVQRIAAQSVDMVQMLNESQVRISGFDNAGYPFVLLNSAPANGDIVANEQTQWFDPTNGAPAFNAKAKQADGTVVNLSIPYGATFPASGTIATRVQWSSAIDFGSIADGTCLQSTFAAAGALVSDNIAMLRPAGLADSVEMTAWVSSAGNLRIQVCNFSGGAIDPASLTYGGEAIR